MKSTGWQYQDCWWFYRNHGLTLCDTKWIDMTWHGLTWYDMLWYAMICYDMPWYAMICYDMLWRDIACNRTQCVYNLVSEPNEQYQILKCHVFVNASAVWEQWHNLHMHIMRLFFPPNILQLTLLASKCKYSGDIAQWCAENQEVPGTRRGGSFQKETWFMGIHGGWKRSKLTWN